MPTTANSTPLTVSEVRVVNAVSPTVDLEEGTDGVEITVTDVEGTKTAKVYNGKVTVSGTKLVFDQVSGGT